MLPVYIPTPTPSFILSVFFHRSVILEIVGRSLRFHRAPPFPPPTRTARRPLRHEPTFCAAVSSKDSHERRWWRLRAPRVAALQAPRRSIEQQRQARTFSHRWRSGRPPCSRR
ncbi:hypothetical protein BDA96_01G279800 [Sorghum bicolor]|uniref:Uncharacterized protein n=1 Tax=Sorghum bicolor TaxID=4558 RepID=A0A921V041_SORBI|nr:hypothetical protein BDA96_01G279800 [Sorghum bicolor]